MIVVNLHLQTESGHMTDKRMGRTAILEDIQTYGQGSGSSASKCCSIFGKQYETYIDPLVILQTRATDKNQFIWPAALAYCIPPSLHGILGREAQHLWLTWPDCNEAGSAGLRQYTINYNQKERISIQSPERATQITPKGASSLSRH